MTTILPNRIDTADLALNTRGLVKRFGSITALDGVDLRIPRGAVYVLVGPNGAGKSTALGIFLGLLRPDEGEAEILGFDPRTHGAAARARVGYVPEAHTWGHRWMRVERLIAYHASFYPAWDQAYASDLIRRLDIQTKARFGKLSKGQARRVQLLLALAHRPPLLLLDEPTDGLDPLIRDELLGILSEHLSETETTVLISTHRVHEAEGMADHIGALQHGRLYAQMPLDEARLKLRRYRAEIPEGWDGAPELNGAVLRRAATPREIRWTVWGNEEEVTGRLQARGAVIRDIERLNLEETALALLTPQTSEGR
jgi:ABC-2 type transport system ATP-binding protein